MSILMFMLRNSAVIGLIVLAVLVQLDVMKPCDVKQLTFLAYISIALGLLSNDRLTRFKERQKEFEDETRL